MDEKSLLELWNTKRTQVINAQKAPNLMLIGVFVLAAFDKFAMASDATKYCRTNHVVYYIIFITALHSC